MLHACKTHINITTTYIPRLSLKQDSTLDTQFPLLAAAVVALFQSKSEHRNSNLRHS